jgi:glycosyltransferase involved in cell wall biosynthesis
MTIMGEPLHSFIIPAFGESQYIEECLRSVQGQTHPSPVCIATSTPAPFLGEVARRHGVPLIINPGPGGIAADWNFAYAQCATKYVTLAHQDDIYAPDYGRCCVAAAERVPDNLITFTDYGEMSDGQRIDGSANLLIKRAILAAAFCFERAIRAPSRKRVLLSLGCAIPCPSVMFNKERIGDFSFSESFRINLDWDAWTRLSQRPGSFCFVRDKLMTHRIHNGAETTKGIGMGLRQREDLMMFRRFWPEPAAGLIAKAYALSLRSRGDPTNGAG